MAGFKTVETTVFWSLFAWKSCSGKKKKKKKCAYDLAIPLKITCKGSNFLFYGTWMNFGGDRTSAGICNRFSPYLFPPHPPRSKSWRHNCQIVHDTSVYPPTLSNYIMVWSSTSSTKRWSKPGWRRQGQHRFQRHCPISRSSKLTKVIYQS